MLFPLAQLCMMYERQNWTRSQICTQYMLGVRFVRECHLALMGETLHIYDSHLS